MHVYRTDHESDFTVLPNLMLQRRDLSFLALGILAYLISLPDANDVTVAKLERMRKEGKAAVRAAVAELREIGYYIKEDRQDERGRVRGWSAVTDTPGVFSQVGPTAEIQPGGFPPVGEPDGGRSAVNPVKDSLVKETTPTPAVPEEKPASEPESPRKASKGSEGRESATSEEIEASKAILGALAARDRRLSVPEKAAERLAPVIAEWLKRGATERQIIEAALTGTNEGIRSAERVIGYRLDKAMPVIAAVTPIKPVVPLTDCDVCYRPWRGKGTCDGCKRGTQASATPDPADDPARKGAAYARQLMMEKLAS